jgi:hypothetical protein
MAKSIKKAAIGASQPPAKEKGKMKMDTSSIKKFKKVSVGKKKPVTDMQRDEMGKPMTPSQKKLQQKEELEMIDYKGRPKMKTGGTLSPSKKSVGKTIGKLNKAKSGSSLGMKSVKAGFDKNPGVTRADIIVAGKGQAKKGAKVKSNGKMSNCKYGCK